MYRMYLLEKLEVLLLCALSSIFPNQIMYVSVAGVSGQHGEPGTGGVGGPL